MLNNGNGFVSPLLAIMAQQDLRSVSSVSLVSELAVRMIQCKSRARFAHYSPERVVMCLLASQSLCDGNPPNVKVDYLVAGTRLLLALIADIRIEFHRAANGHEPGLC